MRGQVALALRVRALSVSLTLDISPARGGDRVTPCHAGQVRQIKKVLYKPKENQTRLLCRRFFFCVPADENT